jgi:HSP20 family molecular chaperone IbpA
VDEESIQAKYVDGVLHLSMLKLPEEKLAASKTIDIM